MNKETFAKINQPLLLLYYYKDDDHQDNVVKVSAMKKMFEEVSTPAGLKKQLPFLTQEIMLWDPISNPAIWRPLKQETSLFAVETLKMRPVSDTTRISSE